MAPAKSVLNGKENRPLERSKISAKDLKNPRLTERNTRGAGGGPLCDKSLPEKPAVHRTQQTGRQPGPVTPRSTPRGPIDPWQEVRQASVEADALEAELKNLVAECEDLEVQVAAAEAQEVEAEQQLTSQSAAMLSEYASAHERFKSLEEELRAAREGLAARRKENLELSRKNIEFDRASRTCHAQIAEAQEELEKCSRSQEAIDEEISAQLKLCEGLRIAAEEQSQRLSSDLRRFEGMKAKLKALLETVALERQKEVHLLMAEADDLEQRTQKSLETCLEVAKKGIVPPEQVLDGDEPPREEVESSPSGLDCLKCQ